jgi:hypothetical protein
LRSAPKLAVHLQVRSCHHGTAQLRPERTAHLDISACFVHTQKHCAQASTHSPYTTETTHIHNTNTPAPRSHLALPCQTRAPASHCTPTATPSTSNPPDRLSRSANCGTAAPHRPPYHLQSCVRQPTSCPFLPAPPSPLHAHRQTLYCCTGTCIDEHRLRKRRS